MELKLQEDCYLLRYFIYVLLRIFSAGIESFKV